MKAQRIAIIGAGAVGGALGARLALAGHTVSLVARGAHLQAIQQHGLQFVDQVTHQSTSIALTATANPAELPPQDALIIALKAPAIPAMLPLLKPLLGPETVVIPAINGMPWWYPYRLTGIAPIKSVDPLGDALQAISGEHILGCVVHFAANVPEPGTVQLNSYQRLLLGEIGHPENVANSARLQMWTQIFNEAGLATAAVSDIRLEMWTKLIGNLSFNPVTALTGYTLAEACDDPGTLSIIRQMMVEGMAVAAASGCPIQMSLDARIEVARGLGHARTSMLQDLTAGRPLETGALIEAVLELAERAQVPTPTCRMVLALLQAVVNKRDAELSAAVR